MLGAIAGDIIGSIYERENCKSKDFPLFGTDNTFTDDTVLTIATADAILNQVPSAEGYREYYKRYSRRYPQAGFGQRFWKWAASDEEQPYYSWGNGSAMRVSPIGLAYNSLGEVLEQAKRSAAVTHNHPEGIKGAKAIATVIFLARMGNSKADIQAYISDTFGYDLNRSIDEIRPIYAFDVSCQGSVPEAILSFLESTDFEDAIRNAISIGGDSDTIASMAGAMAEAFYGEVPEAIAQATWTYLDAPLASITQKFLNVLQ